MRAFAALLAVLVLAPTASAQPRSCVRRLEAAKLELIANGFAPTTDGDTEKWLTVDGDETEASMGMAMGYADGPHTSFEVNTTKAEKSAKPSGWRVRKRALCCDDNHEASDHIIRYTWEKTSKRGVTATIILDRFGDTLKATQAEADVFITTAKRAAEDCLR
ncbi:MAG TPA: hypothetical protein VGM39_17870 [Kofleriaceae bacterium]|jgi:hypothetical protein